MIVPRDLYGHVINIGHVTEVIGHVTFGIMCSSFCRVMCWTQLSLNVAILNNHLPADHY